jgi:hypothetical protein
LGLVESWSRNSRIFFSQFPHLWRLREGPRRPGQLNIYGWFNFRMICGYPNFRTPPYPYIYIHTYIEWLKSCPMGIQITIYRQWYYVLICIGHTAKSNHMCYHPYIALKGRHLLSFSGLNRCLRSIPRM